jgi:hypothetical protein
MGKQKKQSDFFYESKIQDFFLSSAKRKGSLPVSASTRNPDQGSQITAYRIADPDPTIFGVEISDQKERPTYNFKWFVKFYSKLFCLLRTYRRDILHQS